MIRCHADRRFKSSSCRTGSGHPRFAVRPYPKEWEREATLKNGQRVLIRPVRPEDEPLYKAFLAAVSELDLRLHFFSAPAASTEAFRARKPAKPFRLKNPHRIPAPQFIL